MKKSITLLLAVAVVSGLSVLVRADETPENQAEKRLGPPTAEELFAKMDKNSDGQISLEEFQEAMKERPHFAGKRGPRPDRPFDREFRKEHGDQRPGNGKGPHDRKGMEPFGPGRFDGHHNRGPGEWMASPFGDNGPRHGDMKRQRPGPMPGMMHNMMGMGNQGGTPIIIVINGQQGGNAPFFHHQMGKGHFQGKPDRCMGPCCDEKPCGKDGKDCQDDCKCPLQKKGQCPIMEEKQEAEPVE